MAVFGKLVGTRPYVFETTILCCNLQLRFPISVPSRVGHSCCHCDKHRRAICIYFFVDPFMRGCTMDMLLEE